MNDSLKFEFHNIKLTTMVLKFQMVLKILNHHCGFEKFKSILNGFGNFKQFFNLDI